MKTMYICICSEFYKHGRILSKFGMYVIIGYVIIGNENRVKKSKIIFLVFYMFQDLEQKKNLEHENEVGLYLVCMLEHGWILLKLGMQGDTYAVVGRPSNLVLLCYS